MKSQSKCNRFTSFLFFLFLCSVVPDLAQASFKVEITGRGPRKTLLKKEVDIERGYGLDQERVPDRVMSEFLSHMPYRDRPLLFFSKKNVVEKIEQRLTYKSSVSISDVSHFLRSGFWSGTRAMLGAGFLGAAYVAWNYGTPYITSYVPEYVQPCVAPTSLIISMAALYPYTTRLSSTLNQLVFKVGASDSGIKSDKQNRELDQQWLDTSTALSMNQEMGRNIITLIYTRTTAELDSIFNEYNWLLPKNPAAASEHAMQRLGMLFIQLKNLFRDVRFTTANFHLYFRKRMRGFEMVGRQSPSVHLIVDKSAIPRYLDLLKQDVDYDEHTYIQMLDLFLLDPQTEASSITSAPALPSGSSMRPDFDRTTESKSFHQVSPQAVESSTLATPLLLQVQTE
jgi:hypothetical protein